MPINLREVIDGDRIENYNSVTELKTELNQFQMICGTCGMTFYTDQHTYDRFCSTLEKGLDNPFLCFDCQDENDAAAYAGFC